MPSIQAMIFRLVQRRERSAADVAREMRQSLQSASSMLKRLCDAGFLDRQQERQSSGGYEWISTTPD